jgi:DNA helicase HerA-like ATPase
MSLTPIENTASLRIGAVEFVSPDEIKVTLDLEAPDGVAANAGVPRLFPRINSYVLVASEAGHIVSQVEWIAVERSPFPKRKGFQDYGLVDLPFPIRKMRVNPLGLLREEKGKKVFQRGVHGFPSVGEPVLIPTDEQLKSIVESGEKRRVKIGTSPMAAGANVCIDPDRLFGRHLAVLGNTGSGKSCSVAGLIQWSLEAAENELAEDETANARFIVLDPNGEYSKVFEGKGRIFQVGDDEHPLQLPIWFWSSAEWMSFTQASSKAQAPLLKRALRAMRNEDFEFSEGVEVLIKKFLAAILITIKHEKSTGSPWSRFPYPKNFFEKISVWHESIEELKQKLDAADARLDGLLQSLTEYIDARQGKYPRYESTIDEVEGLENEISNAFAEFGGSEQDLLPKNEDVPTRFEGDVFVNYLEALAQETNNIQFVEFLLARIRTMLADTRMKHIIGDEVDVSLKDWLDDYIGDSEQESSVTVIDLSLVPSDIIHIVTSVIARMTFEALQRYRKLHTSSLPTVLVMEEAHTFVKRYREDSENQSVSSVCCQMFERIAREGRKYGLGLVLSSQRPSELSPTVLSQCNSFLLHRVSNDRDQELIHRLVPDNLRGLLRELPSLPSQQAILLGWAAELPLMVRMNDLEDAQRPQSDDPDFWDVWSREKERPVNWAPIVRDWQQTGDEEEQEDQD